MPVSPRTTTQLVFGLLAAAGLAAEARAQTGSDAAVRKAANAPAANTGTAAAPTAAAKPVSAVFGTVDLRAVLDGYDKVKLQKSEFQAAAMTKQKELTKLMTEGQEESQKLAKMVPGTIDAKRIEDRLTELKAKVEATKENASREFTGREAEMLAGLYKEITDMVRRIAVYRGMTYVVQVSNEPVTGTNPESVMAAMASTVVYADPRNDITKDVIFYLNRDYKAHNGPAPAATPAAGATGGN